MIEVGFRERLAYLRWLRARGRLRAETDAEVATALGVGEKWLTKWKGRADAPEGRTEEAAIKASIGAQPAQWLYDGTGPAPEPARWREWLQAREDRVGATAAPRQGPSVIQEPPPDTFDQPVPRRTPRQKPGERPA